MRNQKTIDLVFLAILMSIIIVMAAVPNFGYITFGTLSLTILPVPVIIASIYLNRKIGMLTGAIFGISSMFVAYTRVLETPLTIDYLFRDPSISVLPRVLFPYLTALLYDSLSRYIKNDSINILISAIAGSIFHSVLVLSTLFFFFNNVNYLEKATIVSINENPFTTNIFALVVSVFIGSSLLEALLSGLIATPIIKALKIAFKKYDDKKIDLDNIE